MDTKWMILILTTIIGSRNADAAQEVELADMLAYADQHAPPLVVARQTQLRAQAERAAVPLLVSNPELSVAIGAQVAAPGVGASAGRELEISLVQPLSIAGVRGARMEAAERAGARVDADIEAVRWAVHCDVHAAFHRALVDGARARLAAEVVAFQVDVLRIVEQQIAVGEAAPLTLRLAQAEVAQAQQVLLSATQAVAASRLQLAQLAD